MKETITVKKTKRLFNPIYFLVFIYCSSASATIINFSDGINGVLADGAPTYTEQGFQFLGVPGGHFDNRANVCPDELCWHEGNNNTAEMIVILTFSGGKFDFSEFDITNTPVRIGGFPLLMSSSNGDSATIGPSANTYILNWVNVDWIQFDVQGIFPQDHSVTIDNVVVNSVDNVVVNSVPIPSILVLFGTGLFSMLGLSKRSH